MFSSRKILIAWMSLEVGHALTNYYHEGLKEKNEEHAHLPPMRFLERLLVLIDEY